MRNIVGFTAGFGLLTSTGDVHRQMRKAMNPAFSAASLTARELSLNIECPITLLKFWRQRLICIMSPSTSMLFLTSYPRRYRRVQSLVKILKGQIEGQSNPSEGKVFTMYDWRASSKPVSHIREHLY